LAVLPPENKSSWNPSATRRLSKEEDEREEEEQAEGPPYLPFWAVGVTVHLLVSLILAEKERGGKTIQGGRHSEEEEECL
jgi:hypothetical protein